MASAVQIMRKLITWALKKGSSNRKTAMRNMQLGPIYCRMPTVDSCNRRVQKLKNSRGTAVTTDDVMSIRSMPTPWFKNTPRAF